MWSYFDIETTGLDIVQCQFTCGVVAHNSEMHTFECPYKLSEFLVSIVQNTQTTLVTFNGLSFDFQFLAAKVSDNAPLAKQLATLAKNNHLDIMFAFLVNHGYYASMASFAAPLKLAKTWSGEAAAESTDAAAVAAYCAEDVNILRAIHEASLTNGYLERKSQNGKLMVWATPKNGLATVATALVNESHNPPAQDWMTNPPSILKALEWIKIVL